MSVVKFLVCTAFFSCLRPILVHLFMRLPSIHGSAACMLQFWFACFHIVLLLACLHVLLVPCLHSSAACMLQFCCLHGSQHGSAASIFHSSQCCFHHDIMVVLLACLHDTVLMLPWIYCVHTCCHHATANCMLAYMHATYCTEAFYTLSFGALLQS